MRNTGFGFLPVVEFGAIIGVVTGKDLAIRAAAQRVSLDTASIKGIMSSPVISLSCEADIEEAVVLMRGNSVRRILVTDETGEAVGIVSMTDIEGSVAEEAMERALARHIPKPHHHVERDCLGIPGLYLG